MKQAIALVMLAACSQHGDDAAPDAAAPPPDAPPSPFAAAVPLTGCSWSFTGTFFVGGAPFALTVDTGSATLALSSSTCTTCSAAGVADLYTPSPTAMDQHHSTTIRYDAGEMWWTGEEYVDSVAAGNVKVDMDLYAITNENDFFGLMSCSNPDGILGMQGSGPGNFAGAVAAAGVRDEFAMHECRSTGTLWLGGYDPAAATGPAVTAAMPDDYTANVTDFAIGGTSVGLPASAYGQAIIDSGGPSLIVPQGAYDAITQAVAANPTFAQMFGAATWFAGDQCVQPAATKAELDAALPKLSVTLDGSPVEMAATDSYLMTFDYGGGITYYCSALHTQADFLDLGNSLIRSHLVIFDRAHRQLEVAPTAPCT